MEIATYDMITGETAWLNVDSYVDTNCRARLAYELENSWCWDFTGVSGFKSDALCTFIRFNKKETL